MKNKKILIVDDNSVSLKMLKNIFNSNEYHVFQASGGFEAVYIAKNDHPDLIILDIVMPNKYGCEVCQEIKSDPELQDIQVVMLSSISNEDSRHHAM